MPIGTLEILSQTQSNQFGVSQTQSSPVKPVFRCLAGNGASPGKAPAERRVYSPRRRRTPPSSVGAACKRLMDFHAAPMELADNRAVISINMALPWSLSCRTHRKQPGTKNELFRFEAAIRAGQTQSNQFGARQAESNQFGVSQTQSSPVKPVFRCLAGIGSSLGKAPAERHVYSPRRPRTPPSSVRAACKRLMEWQLSYFRLMEFHAAPMELADNRAVISINMALLWSLSCNAFHRKQSETKNELFRLEAAIRASQT